MGPEPQQQAGLVLRQPRVSGDGPAVDVAQQTGAMAAPRERGWALLERDTFFL